MFLRTLTNRIYVTNIHKTSSEFTSLVTQLNYKFSTFDLNKATECDKPVAKKKTVRVPKITLISPEDNVSITTIEDATKISKRRDLKLVKIIDLDTKTDRPVYKLMTGAHYLAEDLKRRAERKASKQESFIKGEKLLTLSHKISDHDLNSRVRNIEKWLSKPYEVRVVINGDAGCMSAAETIYEKLEKQLPAGRFLQKRQKGSDIRFQILPPKRNKSQDSNSSSKNSDNKNS